MIKLKRRKKTLKDIKENIEKMDWEKKYIKYLYDSMSRGGFPQNGDSNGMAKL